MRVAAAAHKTLAWLLYLFQHHLIRFLVKTDKPKTNQIAIHLSFDIISHSKKCNVYHFCLPVEGNLIPWEVFYFYQQVIMVVNCLLHHKLFATHRYILNQLMMAMTSYDESTKTIDGDRCEHLNDINV